jgi:hypothetical protein
MLGKMHETAERRSRKLLQSNGNQRKKANCPETEEKLCGYMIGGYLDVRYQLECVS